jgi:TolB-like protein
MPTGAVFLSYASEDADAAEGIATALHAAGIEVWYDRGALRGGDAWDRRIREQIHHCRLFVAIISAHTEARDEGYFRREWRLAVERAGDRSERVAFLIPVVIDDTSDSRADVPDRFREVQWTRLPGGVTPTSFVERVQRLLLQEGSSDSAIGTALPPGSATLRTPKQPIKPWRPNAAKWASAAVLALALTWFAIDRLWISKRAPANSMPIPTAQDFAPPPHSIAVLPFVNMSSDKEQDYFSDGLTEEMINLLGQVPDLRVPARTSSFYFKGKNETIANIARQLKVANVLEGSVRKAGKRLRITAQLIRADNGYHVWSQAYDRDDTDIFAVQDDIAGAVVRALQLRLGALAQETGSRGTKNTEAYSEYLRGTQLGQRDSLESLRRAVEAYNRAIALDPNYAAAWAERAIAAATLADLTGDARAIERAEHDVNEAIALAPTDATGYSARSYLRTVWLWDWSGAQMDIEKALSLGPRTRSLLGRYARLLADLGRLPEAIAAQQQASDLDPLSSGAWDNLGFYYMSTGAYGASGTSLGRALEIEPASVIALSYLGALRLLQGNVGEALVAFRKIDQEGFRLAGIAMAEHSLGHPQESKQALEALMAAHANEQAYQIAEAFAWCGEKTEAFEWLERAYTQRDGGISFIKIAPMLKSLHGDPRFENLLHKLQLPE